MKLKKITNRLIGIKGVKHGKLTTTTAGKELDSDGDRLNPAP